MRLLSRLQLFVSALICAAALLTETSCSSTSAVAGGNPKLPDASSVANLRPGDSLVITLQGVPDPTANTLQIDEQGLVTLPYIGSVTAAGNTTASLSQKVRETYLSKKIYTSVDVSVTVTERFVYVGGEVAHPGRIVWTPDLTVTKAIQAAGGFTLYAKETKLSLIRERVSYAINAHLAQNSPTEDPRLMPGDAIQVPKSAF